MTYEKPLLELLVFDVEDIITVSSALDNPTDPPVVDELIVQVPTGGTMGSFEDFEDNNSSAPAFYKPF